MRDRRLFSISVALLLAAALAGPAHAGGWWSTIEVGPYVGVGETLTVRAHPMFGTIAAADEAHGSGGYFAYLLKGVDERMVDDAMSTAEPGDWWTPPPVRYRIGTVQLSGLDANLANASAEVTIPDVPPGEYSLMLCTAECARPLADVVPTEVVVSGDAPVAAAARRLTATKWRLMSKASRAEHRLDGARKRLEDVREDLDVESDAADELEEKVGELTAALAARSGGGPGFGDGLAYGFAGGLFAAGSVWALRRLRSSRAGGIPAPAPERRSHPGRRRRRPRTTPGPA